MLQRGRNLGTDNIAIAVSLDYGQHWSAGHQMNSGTSGRRFFPAICITSGNAFVGWYDRRAATAANNDLTDYLSSGNTMLDGALPDTPVSEINLTEVPDPECDSGWPAAPRSKNDAGILFAPTAISRRVQEGHDVMFLYRSARLPVR